MRSRRSFLHLGLVTAATLAGSSALAVPAYFGSPRGGGTVTARDDAARTFTAARLDIPGHRQDPVRARGGARLVVGCQGRHGRASEVASCGHQADSRCRQH